ncbi:transferrin-binding protein-like solute binding protein [Loktanella agnita]
MSDDPISGNGLPFASGGRSLADTEGTTMSLQGARLQQNGDGAIDSGTIRLDAGFFDADIDAERNAMATIFGEEIVITNGVGQVTTGEEVLLIYNFNDSGLYAGAVQFTVSSNNGADGTIDGEVAYVFGYETNPADLPSGSGTTTYEGGFQAAGYVGETSPDYEGTLSVEVSFANDFARVELNGKLDGEDSLNLSGSNLALSGNGFSGGLNCSAGCLTSSSEIDASFYGPNAEEVGGVLLIETNRYEGVGSFIID